MPQSTPLENIETDNVQEAGGSDEERVQRIIREMNAGEEQGNPGSEPQAMAPPGMQYQMPPQMMGQPTMIEQQRGHEMQHPSMLYQQAQPAPEPEKPVVSKKNIWAHISDAFKLPLVVSVVFFLLSLPVVDVYLARYAHWAFSSGGHLSMLGLALKAVAAGAVMGVYDTLDKLLSRFF
jgi:hypothetical protein